MNRRTALKSLAAVSALLPAITTPAHAAVATDSSAKKVPFGFGVATVSLKGLPLDNALAAVKRVGLDRISLNRAHSPWDSGPPAWKAVAEKIRAAGIAAPCCGVLYLENAEPAMRRMMEYVRALGAPLVSCSISPEALPLLEKLVREYDLRAAIHNHGPEDKSWPSATKVWEAVQSLDTRIGLCLDVGHSYRSGEDPVALISRFRTRLYDVHLKDTDAAVGAMKDTDPIELGRGKLDVAGMLTALIEIGYRETVWFEYEKEPNDPVPGLAESVGYVRGLLRGLNFA